MSFYCWQYSENACKQFWRPAGLSAIITVSSAYKNENNLRYNSTSLSEMPSVIPDKFLYKRCDSKSLRYSAKRTGDRFFPCLTPQSQAKKDESWPFIETHDLMPLYKLWITWKKLPFILLSSSFRHKLMRHTESNALEKSINSQYNFFFLARCNSRSLLRVKMWSMVEYPLRKPAWFSLSPPVASRHFSSLLLRTEVKTLP